MLRQLMTESLLIAIVGGLLGSVLALWSFQALVALALPTALPPEIPAFAWALDFRPDFRVLSFAIALTLGTGLLFGLAPALHVSKADLNAVIKQDAVGAGSNRRGGRLRVTFVGVQVALSMVLMIATGLLLRGLYATYTIDPVSTTVTWPSCPSGRLRPRRRPDQRLMDQVGAWTGVEAVGYASQTPWVIDDGRRDSPSGVRASRRSSSRSSTASRGLFFSARHSHRALAATSRGRECECRAPCRHASVIVIETAARRFWGGPETRSVEPSSRMPCRVVRSRWSRRCGPRMRS